MEKNLEKVMKYSSQIELRMRICSKIEGIKL